MILDAEYLAEGGVASAYESMSGRLRALGITPAAVIEDLDEGASRYSVRALGRDYPIYGSGVEGDSWVLATFALFDIVNAQLTKQKVFFYALNAGNDLLGIFLTPEQAEKAKVALADQPDDWPYFPAADAKRRDPFG